MTDYIITEAETRCLCDLCQKKVLSRPLSEELKSERERVLDTLIQKIDSCIGACPSDARQKPKTMLKRFKQTIESLRSEQP